MRECRNRPPRPRPRPRPRRWRRWRPTLAALLLLACTADPDDPADAAPPDAAPAPDAHEADAGRPDASATDAALSDAAPTSVCAPLGDDVEASLNVEMIPVGEAPTNPGLCMDGALHRLDGRARVVSVSPWAIALQFPDTDPAMDVSTRGVFAFQVARVRAVEGPPATCPVEARPSDAPPVVTVSTDPPLPPLAVYTSIDFGVIARAEPGEVLIDSELGCRADGSPGRGITRVTMRGEFGDLGLRAGDAGMISFGAWAREGAPPKQVVAIAAGTGPGMPPDRGHRKRERRWHARRHTLRGAAGGRPVLRADRPRREARRSGRLPARGTGRGTRRGAVPPRAAARRSVTPPPAPD